VSRLWLPRILLLQNPDSHNSRRNGERPACRARCACPCAARRSARDRPKRRPSRSHARGFPIEQHASATLRSKTVGWRGSPRMLTALSYLEHGERRINGCNTISPASRSAVKICSRHEDEAARLVETHLHAPYFRFAKPKRVAIGRTHSRRHPRRNFPAPPPAGRKDFTVSESVAISVETLPDRPGPRAQFERRRDEFLPRDLTLLHAAGRYTM
jgi:hypothetical protein